jgi:exodeoxyribonuclease-3
MKLTTWNVNGIRAILKKNFVEDIQKLSPDILCLQETKADKDTVLELIKNLNFPYKYANAAQKKGYSGTALLSKIEPLSVSYGIGIGEHDNEGRVITAEFPQFYLVNVYTPNSGQGLKRLDYRKEWNKVFKEYLEKLEQKKPVIACGDFNVAHQPIDLKNPKSNYNKTAGYTQVEIDAMTELIEAGFIDAFRYLYPDKIQYTYWNYRFRARERNAGWRIDYFLVSKKLIDKVKDVIIHDDIFGSDHAPVSLIIDL